MANRKFRVLVASVIGGLALRPNDVVALPDALAKAHADALDGNKEAVAYALRENGNKVIEHRQPELSEVTALTGEIAQLDAAIAAATEADKPALEAQLAEKRAALAELQG